MSQSHYETVVCPGCQNAKKFAVWDLINVTKDPLLEAPLLSGELTTFRCRKCKTETPIRRDLLYHDMLRKFALWLKHPGGNSPALATAAASLLASLSSDYACRLVASFDELAEKIRLTRDGHSDVAMELVKFGLISRMKLSADLPVLYFATEIDRLGRRTFVFHCQEGKGPLAIRSQESDSSSILRDHLRAVQAQAATIGNQWVRVDRAHLLQAIGLQAPRDSTAAGISLDNQSIQVYTLGQSPEFDSPHEMDAWVAAGATTFQATTWRIGREVSAREVELHRDRKTGCLYVVFRRMGRNWKRHFVARTIFEELKAKEARV